MSELSTPLLSESSQVSQSLPARVPVETPAAQMAQAAAEELGGVQRRVMSLLAAGNSVAKAAQLGQISRGTVYRWLREDPAFRAVYNAWQRELVQSARGRLLALADDAIDAIHDAIIGGNVAASLTVARSMGLLERPRIGPDDPARVARRQRARQKRQAASDLKIAESARNSLPIDHPLHYTAEDLAELKEQAERERAERRRRENAKTHPESNPRPADPPAGG